MKSRSLKIVGIAVVLLGVALVIIGPWRNNLKPANTRELTLEQLTRRDGRMFVTGEKEPFTGFLVERYASGALKARSRLEAGVLNGLSEGWFSNGVMQIRETFVEGVSHGARTKWYDNGRKMSEATIQNGKVVGEFRRWHENGELAEVVHLKNGEPEGESWAFYPSGYARATVQHHDGALVRQEFWKDRERKITLAETTP